MVDNSTSSEMDIPNGEGFGYAPKIYTNPKFVATLAQTNTECSDLEVVQNNFIGEYCENVLKNTIDVGVMDQTGMRI